MRKVNVPFISILSTNKMPPFVEKKKKKSYVKKKKKNKFNGKSNEEKK